MIRLRKLDRPQVLEDNFDAWTAELQSAIQANDPQIEKLKLRYRHADIKAALVEETHGKCAYCESQVRHVFPGDTEHIAPSSKRPDLTYQWTNLTLVCGVCNRNKWD